MSVLIGSSASGSSLRSRLRANSERARIQRSAGWMAAKTSGLSAIEISAPATIRLCPSASSTPSDTPSAARMNENSPICARLADTVSAVFSG